MSKITATILGLILLAAPLAAASTAPKVLTSQSPVYPLKARAAGVQGVVKVDVVVDAQGRVAAAEVATPLAPELDAAALRAIHQWTFTPMVRDGVAMTSVVRVPVQFVLGPAVDGANLANARSLAQSE